MTNRRRAFTLIEILVVIVIIAIMLAMVGNMLTGRTAKGEKGKSPIQRAQGTACISNLNQLRQGIMLQRTMDENEANPPGLAQLKFPAEVLQCPDGKAAYLYDPASGRVWCVTQGHERY